MSTQGWTLFVDIQFMQTGAFGRGMGQHVRGLMKSLVARPTDGLQKVVYVYNQNLPIENIETFKQEMHGQSPVLSIEFNGRDFLQHDLQKAGDYDSVYAHNQRIVSAYFRKEATEKDFWFIACPMQEPVVPALPLKGVSIRTGVLWYDLMPYQMHDHYFSDPATPYAHSYLKRVGLLLEYDTVMTISDTSRADLARYISLDVTKVVNTRGAPNTEISGEGLLPKAVKKPFILLNTSAEPNKNAIRAIKAFGIFNEAVKNRYQLVITSHPSNEMLKQAEKYGGSIIFPGHISSADLKALYEQSELVFFPSLYEGLGLAGLEAIKFGKKVVCADIPMLREFNVDKAFYWCDPLDEDNMARKLNECIQSGVDLSREQRKVYADNQKIFNWEVSAQAVLECMAKTHKRNAPASKIAVVAPHPSSFSSIGKFAAEAYPYLTQFGEVDYYYDSGPSDRRHGKVRFHYLQASDRLRPIASLINKINKYDQVLYHMGNSDHHMLTYLLAHAKPRTLILHDTDLSGKGLSGQMLSNGFINQERLDVEKKIELDYLKQSERFITSLVSASPRVVTHSDYARDVVGAYLVDPQKVGVRRLEHPIHKIDYRQPKRFAERPLRYAIAGIVTEVKGTNAIEWLMEHTNGLRGAELNIFGFGFFADKQLLLSLQEKYANVHVQFDLSDFEFNNLLSSMDVLINYREVYKGEASRATLEAMRERVVPIVRNVGWFGELGEGVAYQLDNFESIAELINRLNSNRSAAEVELQQMIAAGQKVIEKQFGIDVYQRKVLEK